MSSCRRHASWQCSPNSAIDEELLLLRRSCRAARAACHEGLVQISVLHPMCGYSPEKRCLPSSDRQRVHVSERAMLEMIEEQLTLMSASGSFATRRSAPTKDLQLEVRGVGPIRLPVSAAAARKLCAVARPARHGYKDETRLDASIRDTWEIPKSRIAIDARAWKRTLAPQLERIRRDLGLPDRRRRRAPSLGRARPPARGNAKVCRRRRGSSLFRSPIDAPHSHNLHASSRIVTCQRVRAALPWPA